MSKTHRRAAGNARIEVLLGLIAALLIAILAAIVMPGLDGTTAKVAAPTPAEAPTPGPSEAFGRMIEREQAKIDAMSPEQRELHARKAKDAALQSNLATIRQALELYGVQHDDTHPTDPVEQLTHETNADGSLGDRYGPYIRRDWPANPINGDARVRLVATLPDAPLGDEGWIYALDTGELRANVVGTDTDGDAYFDS